MLELFIKHFTKKINRFVSKKTYSDYSYKTLIKDRYSNLEYYFFILNKVSTKKSEHTNIPLRTLNSNLGLTKTEVLQKNGSPRAIVYIDSRLNTEILYYKKYIGEYKAKIEFHLHKDVLFFINLKFIDLNKESKTEVLNVIKQKYNCNSIDFDSSYLVDNNESMLYIDKKINMNIRYMSMSNSFFKSLKKELFSSKEQNNTLKKEKQIKTLHENL